MADLRRLGKRGSYRLGRLGRPQVGPPVSRPVRYPSFAARRRGPVILWLTAWLAGVLIVAAAALVGWWFLPFLAGLAAGMAGRYGHFRLWVMVLAAAAVGACGWALALWWLVLQGLPEGAMARVIAALAGLPPHAAVTIAATLVVAAIQAVTGLWLGRALAPRQSRAGR